MSVPSTSLPVVTSCAPGAEGVSSVAGDVIDSDTGMGSVRPNVMGPKTVSPLGTPGRNGEAPRSILLARSQTTRTRNSPTGTGTLPSANVPSELTWTWRFRIVAMHSSFRTWGGRTVITSVDTTVPLVAWIVAVPFDTAVTKPFGPTVATAGWLDSYVVPKLEAVTSWVVPFDKVAVTINCAVSPGFVSVVEGTVIASAVGTGPLGGGRGRFASASGGKPSASARQTRNGLSRRHISSGMITTVSCADRSAHSIGLATRELHELPERVDGESLVIASPLRQGVLKIEVQAP